MAPAKVALAARMALMRKQQGSGNIEDNIAAAYYVRATQISMMLPGYALLSLYPDSGHSPFSEEPDRYTRELAEFARGR